jgi:hypothetical protein
MCRQPVRYETKESPDETRTSHRGYRGLGGRGAAYRAPVGAAHAAATVVNPDFKLDGGTTTPTGWTTYSPNGTADAGAGRRDRLPVHPGYWIGTRRLARDTRRSPH